MKKIFAFLCLLAIVILFPLTLLSTVVKYSLFTPTTIKRIVRTSQLAESLPALIVAAVTSTQAPDNTEALDLAVTENLITTALPAEQVYSITDEIIDAVGLWWNTDQPIEQIELTLDLSTITQNLAPALEQQFSKYVEKLPTCGDETQPANLEMQDLDCLPANTDIANFMNSNSSIGNTLLQNVPDQIDAGFFISEELRKGHVPLQNVNQTVNQLRSLWNWLTLGIWIGWGVIGLSLLLMILLRLRPEYAAFGWLGWTFFMVTLELAPLSLLLWLAPQLILPWLSTAVNMVGIKIMNTVLTEVAHVLAWPVTWTLVGAVGVMIGCIILRLITKHVLQPTAQPPLQ